MMLFASLVLEREPVQWSQLPGALMAWCQNAGAVAAFGVALVLLAQTVTRNPNEWIVWNISDRLRPIYSLLRYFVIAAGIGYAALILLWLGDLFRIPGLRRFLPGAGGDLAYTAGDWILTIAGIFALAVAMTPVLVDMLTRWRWGRIWAIARLSWKEAIRGRVIWVFGAMALVFLFADWFVSYKAENQVRSYVQVVYWSMTPLFLLTAGLLGSFSIPTDVLNNSIHTIVTKPVEKFEIVLGRFIGYAALLTVGLFTLAALSLLYVVRGVTEEARHESYKARVPIYGHLHFAGTKNAQKGDSVGREWTYRSYITGPTRRQQQALRQYAIWDFARIPAELGDREVPILFEFAFDIFRLSKGEIEGKGVYCTFTFTDGMRDSRELDLLSFEMKKEQDSLVAPHAKKKESDRAKQIDALQREIDALEKQNLAADAFKEKKKEAETRYGKEFEKIEQEFREEQKKIVMQMTAKYRIFQAREEVIDYHTQVLAVPPEVLKILMSQHDDPSVPKLRVIMSVDQAAEAQMVGVAQQDFYLLAYERPFWQNFLKGIVGMWCTHMLVLGVSIACSTYLSSIISLLNTMFLFIAGMFVDYLKEIAERRLDGGGPFESSLRITGRMPIAARLEPSPTSTVIQTLDSAFSWWIGRIMNLLPDVNRHDLHNYVANGFDISWMDILLLDNFLPLAAYLIPWAILAYYLMKYREIANPQ